MTIISLTIPDDAAAWPEWLERQLVGLHLRDLIDELHVIAPPEEPAPSLNEVIQGQREDVLQRGLSVLESDRLSLLIRHPELLLELQELVLIEGGPHWQSIPVAEETQTSANRVAHQVQEALKSENDATATPARQRDSSEFHKTRRIYIVAVAIAASVLVVLGIRSQFTPKPSIAFVWEQPESLDSSLSPEEYGESLSKSLDDWWFSERPDTKAELAARLQRFHAGCETVIAAKHPQLTLEQRELLVTKCKNWLAKIDKHLADVKAGGSNLAALRESSDETVRATVNALKQLFG